MKPLKIISAVALSIMISMTACEKEGDDILSDASQNSSTTASKSSATPTKSGGQFPADYWDDLQQFIHDVMEDAPLSDMEVEKALYYTESALDWRLVNEDSSHFTDIVVHEEQYIVGNLSTQNNEFYISSTDLETLNDDIHSDIFDQANTIANDAQVPVVVHVVDLTWEIDAGGTATVDVKTYYGRQKVAVQCYTIEDRLAGIRKKCAGTPTAGSAAEHINGFTWPLSCGTWNNKLNCSRLNGIIINTQTVGFIGGTDCGANLFDGSSNTCRTAIDNDRNHSEVQTAWNLQQCISILYVGYLKHVWFVDHKNGSTSDHGAAYITADCKPLCTTGPLCAPPLNMVPTVFPQSTQ